MKFASPSPPAPASKSLFFRIFWARRGMRADAGLCDVLRGLRVSNGRAKAPLLASVSVGQFWYLVFRKHCCAPNCEYSLAWQRPFESDNADTRCLSRSEIL